MRTIALEEHFATPAFLGGPGHALRESARAGRLIDKLLDLGSDRIARMDKAGIDMQVVSLTSPGVEQADPAEAAAIARDANDYVAEAVRRNPARLAAFATIPTPDPAAAVDELARALSQGFKGAMINGHCRGRYLDDQFFWPILECAEDLSAPIYIHPTVPPKAVIDAYYSGFSHSVETMLSTAGFGWHIETAVHALRIILCGVLDRFPRLQIILGHLGETLPFMMERLDLMAAPMTGLQKPVSAYLRENFHFTMSGFNHAPAFLNLLLEVGADRIMFSADHPYAAMTAARGFLDHLPVNPADREKIAHGNAEALLRIAPGAG